MYKIKITRHQLILQKGITNNILSVLITIKFFFKCNFCKVLIARHAVITLQKLRKKKNLKIVKIF